MLIYENNVKDNKEQFIAKVKEISQKLRINPNWLMFVMYKESGLNPKAVNPAGGATGLIQFMPSTATGLGTSTAALYQMSNVMQLDYVYKYFSRGVGKFNSVYDLYLYTFYPMAMGKSESYILGSEKSNEYARRLKQVNYPTKPGDTVSLGQWYKYKEEQILKNVPLEYQSQFQKKKI